MSHFSIAVITKGRPSQDFLESKINPFLEAVHIAPYIRMTKEQWIIKKRDEMDKYKKSFYDIYAKNPSAYIAENADNPAHIEYVRNYMSVYNRTDEQLIEELSKEYPRWDDPELSDYDEYVDADFNIISTYNPQGYVDYWTVGGRWNNGIPLKNGKSANSAHIKDIKFCEDNLCELCGDAANVKEYKTLITEGDYFFNGAYFKEKYPSIEDYVREKASWHTYAVIDQNGRWHSEGKMGWFGVSSESPAEHTAWVKEYQKRFFSGISEYWYVTIVDGHI